jgi:hypothetical protein
MQAAVATPNEIRSAHESASWKRNIAVLSGILLGIVFLVSGGWKVLSPFKTGELLEQAQVPAGWGAIGAAVLGSIELLAAFMLFVPRLRRWGGLLGSGLLVFFIGWVAFYYNKLVGQESSFFPFIKRTVGPGFFVGDGIMLLLGVAAFAWSARVVRSKLPLFAAVLLAAVAAISFGVKAGERSHAQVPTPVVVDGKPANLADGKVFLFFYDPSCMHCDAAAKFMSKLDWGTTHIVAIPTVNPQWAASFLHDTHFKQASTSLEFTKLKKAFPFGDPPYGVALEDGQVKQTFTQMQFNEPLPAPDLKKLGFVK